MKRFLVSLLIMLLISASALADLPDFSSMSFEELFAYKQAVDSEYNSRPEGEGIVLNEGIYTIGKDILPGHYYIAMVYPARRYDYTEVAIYDTFELYKSDESFLKKLAVFHNFLYLDEKPYSVFLNENNVLIVDEAPVFIKASDFDPEDYYKYEPPTGTLVPKGEYIVGEDIPAGTYNIYPATIHSGEFEIRTLVQNEDGSTEYKKLSESVVKVEQDEIGCLTRTLEETNLFMVKKSVIMTKKPKLNFD